MSSTQPADGLRALSECRILHIPRITDVRGNLSFIESLRTVPFAFRRAYWIYSVPAGERRGAGHAYRTMEEFVIPLSGSFEITVTDGSEERVFSMNRPYVGLYIPNSLWRRFDKFSTNALCLMLASADYDRADYIYDRAEFERWRAGARAELS